LPTKDHIEIVPNGVDEFFFSSSGSLSPHHEIVFVGNLGYQPNIVAVEFLINRLLPVLLRRNKTIRLLVAGARPSWKVRSLASKNPNVTLRSWVKDIREAYGDGRIFVAPMFTGLGMQNKLLEAMAMKLPCITTSLVNNALNARPGEQIIVADDVEAMADQIVYLLTHPDQLDRIALSGYYFVREHYRWEDQVKKMERYIQTKNVYLVK
jgi:glycosyltransferase involved in cell wall biosynthesis